MLGQFNLQLFLVVFVAVCLIQRTPWESSLKLFNLPLYNYYYFKISQQPVVLYIVCYAFSFFHSPSIIMYALSYVVVFRSVFSVKMLFTNTFFTLYSVTVLRVMRNVYLHFSICMAKCIVSFLPLPLSILSRWTNSDRYFILLDYQCTHFYM